MRVNDGTTPDGVAFHLGDISPTARNDVADQMAGLTLRGHLRKNQHNRYWANPTEGEAAA